MLGQDLDLDEMPEQDLVLTGPGGSKPDPGEDGGPGPGPLKVQIVFYPPLKLPLSKKG